MEGDTELGLAVKNALDAADLSGVTGWLRRAARFAAD
jgi:predicted lipid carrier protein YhbT